MNKISSRAFLPFLNGPDRISMWLSCGSTVDKQNKGLQTFRCKTCESCTDVLLLTE